MNVAVADPVQAVRGLSEQIRTQCAEVDRLRAIPSTVVRSLQDLDVFHLLAPRELGGHELDPMSFADIVEAASYADGSAGWCVMIGGCYATFGGLLPAAGARELFGDPETICAGAFRPIGVAHEVEGGYRLTGRWPLASGSSHATWYVGGCIVHRDGQPVIQPNGQPLVREAFFPAAETEILDTWDATGLRGTASHDYTVTDAFIPFERTCWFQEPPVHDGPLYRMPSIAMFSTFIASVPLGIARHAIEELEEIAGAKTPVLTANLLADRGTVQDRVGRALALVRSGRAYVASALGEVWDKVVAGGQPTLADRASLWLASTHAAHSAVEAIELMYSTAGSTAVYARCPLDRCLRDARTAAQHICTQVANFELAGRVALGRDAIASPLGMDYRGEG
jgi:alkylation response protein AidB-like acyl-CoA dehydrogenase